jgi:hypothetical protein
MKNMRKLKKSNFIILLTGLLIISKNDKIMDLNYRFQPWGPNFRRAYGISQHPEVRKSFFLFKFFSFSYILTAMQKSFFNIQEGYLWGGGVEADLAEYELSTLYLLSVLNFTLPFYSYYPNSCHLSAAFILIDTLFGTRTSLLLCGLTY